MDGRHAAIVGRRAELDEIVRLLDRSGHSAADDVRDADAMHILVPAVGF